MDERKITLHQIEHWLATSSENKHTQYNTFTYRCVYFVLLLKFYIINMAKYICMYIICMYIDSRHIFYSRSHVTHTHTNTRTCTNKNQFTFMIEWNRLRWNNNIKPLTRVVCVSKHFVRAQKIANNIYFFQSQQRRVSYIYYIVIIHNY